MRNHCFKSSIRSGVVRLNKGACMALLLTSMSACSFTPGARLDRISLPAGFSISIYEDNVPGARTLAFGDKGTLFVGTYKEGKVYAIPARNGDEGGVLVIAEGLQNPHGVAFRDGSLYVAERSRIVRFDDVENRLAQPPAPRVIYDLGLKYAHHGLRVMHFGPDGKLYVSIGVPCNICMPEADRYGIIIRIDSNGKAEVFARGIRNSVGYDWHPDTHELWFTDNGRDLLGDDAPPDELNHAPVAGMHFGYPYCHAGELPDPVFGLRNPCSEFTGPAQRLGPHVAALGMRFYTGHQFPVSYQNRIFIAEHGSWNRSSKLGYRVSMVTFAGNEAVKYEPFAEGWLQGNSAWGRPVDVIVAPDGALMVSDDKSGAIYRISYGNH
ncbi:PQQ-dependent sugar dehydrogenase [Methylobacter luteus]|uniref:PQQ-dependent sugar dehydrogenase n=1 Tax=Methylobacter luteus TaxID=415 RepID=UPI000564243F|nr:PQQ-dependent sugar dehydrogenase [Methylobacter luteus]